jgi:hypothetical protein
MRDIADASEKKSVAINRVKRICMSREGCNQFTCPLHISPPTPQCPPSNRPLYPREEEVRREAYENEWEGGKLGTVFTRLATLSTSSCCEEQRRYTNVLPAQYPPVIAEAVVKQYEGGGTASGLLQPSESQHSTSVNKPGKTTGRIPIPQSSSEPQYVRTH